MESLGDIGANALLGLGHALSWTNLYYCFLGVLLGTFLGVIPGIGVLISMSLLFPITFHLEPSAALIMLAGIYYGTAYGGSTASILLNLPGTPQNAVTCLDGYPMAKQGRAGVALLMTTIGSFVGGSVGIVLMMMFSPVIAHYSIHFAAWDYFSLMLLGLVAASTVAGGSPVKGLSMVVFGMLLGTVGTDINSGIMRYTFGVLELYEGISLIALAMAVFGLSEVVVSITKMPDTQAGPERITLRSMAPTRDDWRRSWWPMGRSASIGSAVGALPGMGGLVAAFMAYSVEKRIAREPDRFGNGAIEGVIAPETANNAADQTAFIPTLTLGIPGSASMAIILGVLLIHGITPGPRLVLDQPDIFWGLVMSFWIGNVMLLILNIPLIGVWVSVLRIPYRLLYPAILVFVCIGMYSVSRNPMDIWMLFIFAAVGYCARILGFSAAPLILGFVLGPMMEEHFRRAMLLSHGDLTSFFQRPVSAVLILITSGLLLFTAVSFALAVRNAARAKVEAH